MFCFVQNTYICLHCYITSVVTLWLVVWSTPMRSANGKSIMRAPGNLSSVSPPLFLGLTTLWAHGTRPFIRRAWHGWGVCCCWVVIERRTTETTWAATRSSEYLWETSADQHSRINSVIIATSHPLFSRELHVRITTTSMVNKFT
jgi:hypothetical protein